MTNRNATTWLDELPCIDPGALPAVFPDSHGPALDSPRATWRKTQHEAEDRRGASRARELIRRLPARDESLHYLWSGQFRHATIIGVVLDLAACPCRLLSVATLGFDDRCTDLLLGELDAGRIARIDVVSSIYHQAHNPTQSKRLTDELAQRGSRHRPAKCHAKVLSFQFADGRAAVVESSSNLRSCQMQELSTISGDPALAKWHAGWIAEVLDREQAR
ncbi:MAG: hypothetical protein GX575_13740 [Candidatus Anammoximicrobium sp.]|nr:hypothetical protein [Candidatus Anammoximicrobium sp.]